jgi:methionine-rich copper-binding protein CopC
MRRFGAALVAVLLAALTTLAGATPALAHNVLVSSNPANGARLDTAPQQVSFTFDQPIQNFDPALKVFGPNGNEFTTAAPTVQGDTVSAPIAAGPAGDYRAAFRIVSSDGHPVTGEITFTRTHAAAGTATGAPTSAADPDVNATDATGSPGGLGVWLWVIVGAAAVLVVIAIVIALRRPHDERDERATES